MGFRFQRRINLGGGWGLNTSGSGGSLSYRSRHGSIGTKGFSLRTGIPGLSYRQAWGKNAGGAAAVVMTVVLVLAVAAIAVKVLVYALPVIWNCLKWVVLTIYDLFTYGRQQMNTRHSQGTPLRHPIARDVFVGAVLCGAIGLLGLYLSDDKTSHVAPAITTASEVPRDLKEATRGAVENASRPRPVNESRPQLYDDLARVRASDTGAAARIEGLCGNSTTKQTSGRDETVARCRRNEMAAWMRLHLYNEFPSLSPTILQKCTSPPWAASYVTEEECERSASLSVSQ